MLDQYYSFLSRELISWLNNKKDIKNADKYFVLLDDENEAEKFYNSLKKLDFDNKFNFKSNEYKYETIGLKTDNTNVIFVSPINGITQDFLVTIRNRVNENEGDWRNTSVFFIVYDALDSIIGGAYDITQKDAPFNINTIQKNINKNIEKNNNINEAEKDLLNNYLEQIVKNSNSTLKDYEIIFGVLYQGKIETKDYTNLGYFYDANLNTYKDKNSRLDRISKNKEMFEKVESLFTFSSNKFEIKESLEELVQGDSLINNLSEEEKWKDVKFDDIYKGITKLEQLKGSNIEFSEDNFNKEDNENFWIRFSGNTAAKRKKMFILANSKYISNEGCLNIEFTENIKRSFINEKQRFLIDEDKNLINLKFSISKNSLKIDLENIDIDKTYAGNIRYIHNDTNRLKFEIIFMIVPFNLREINKLQPNFEIKIRKSKKDFYFDISNEVVKYEFGLNPTQKIYIKSLINNPNQNINNSIITLKDKNGLDYEGDSELMFKTRLGESYFPISLSDIVQKPHPSKPITIEKLRLSSTNQLIYEDEKIQCGSKILSLYPQFKKCLKIEKDMVDKYSLYNSFYLDELYEESIELPLEIENIYKKLLDFYKYENTLPSLAINNEEYVTLLEEIESKIFNELNNIKEDICIPNKVKNILKIGVINSGDDIIITPINPLLISYQLELYRQLKFSSNILREQILSTLNPEYLVPYLKIENDIGKFYSGQYQCNYTKDIPRWLKYKKIEERQITDLGRNIITKRLEDFITQYDYLFNASPKLSLNIAAINITDENNFFEAIIEYMINRLIDLKDIDLVNPLNVYLDNISKNTGSLFRNLYEFKSLEQLEESIGTSSLNIKDSKFSDREIMEFLQNKINLFKFDKEKIKDENLYFHITFYQSKELREIDRNKNFNLGKNYSLAGLLNGPQFTKLDNKYINGFGLGKIKENSSNLIKLSTKINSMLTSMTSDNQIFNNEDVLVNYIESLKDSEINPLVNNSHWLTFLNLDVDLSYFFDEDNKDMLVIHYTDQSTTSRYESITVTNDIEQYDYLIRELLVELAVDNSYYDTKEVIKNFNVINGQWLLKLISENKKSNKNINILREKLSILSSYKIIMGILDHKDFIWIPISLEEILRVSGMVGLKSKDGLFSAKNLGKSGATSDDLLFMGLENRYGKLYIHFLPIEVKIGINDSSVTDKAYKQVKKTSQILKEFLTDKNKDTFMRKYYMNLFISIMLSNLEKIISSNLYNIGINLDEYNILKDKLNIGEYKLSTDLENIYGEGLVFKFTKDKNIRETKLNKEKNIYEVEVPEIDAYDIVSKKVDDIIYKIQNNEYDYHKNSILKNVYKSNPTEITKNNNLYLNNEKDIFKVSEAHIEYETNKNNSKNNIEINDLNKKDIVTNELNRIDKQLNNDLNLNDIRLLIGNHKNSNSKIYWEYGNEKLSNRHLIITGKSGQGKTYFIQTLLSEFSKFNLNTLILDYTDGFKRDQLEDSLINSLGDKLNERYIYIDKLPINPFKLQKIDLGGIIIDETVDDMVDRVEQILDFVFNLGIQQRTILSETIKEGYNRTGGKYTFSELKKDLQDENNQNKNNLYGRLRPLLAREVFMYDTDFTWDEVFGNEGKINIFQFSGYQTDIQKVMIEFLLWDLFQYAKSGNESNPLPIILDEIQNLNFNADSPIVKILREGRKYGVSGIFATQALVSIKGNDSESIYNAAQQIHFLPPDNQVKNISKMITSDKDKQNQVEILLKNLHKGEGLIYGPIKKDDGKLSTPEYNSVNIMSFEDREKIN